MAETSTRRLELWTRGLIAGISIVSLAILWILFFTSTLGERVKAESVQAERQLRSATSLSRSLANLWGDARLALELLVRQVANHPDENALRSKEFLSLVQTLRYRSVQQFDIRGFNRDGDRVVFDGPPLRPAVSASALPFFSDQAAFPGVGFRIDAPVWEGDPGDWVLYSSQSVPPHQGDLAVLTVALPSTQLDGLVRLHVDSSDDTVTLYRSDGTVLYQWPRSEAWTPGSSPVVSEIQALRAVSGRLGGPDLRTYARADDLPVWTVVSRPASQLSDQWVAGVVGQAIWVLLLTAFVVAATVVLLRLMNRLREVRLEQERLARSDPLTNLLNRRAFLERCELEQNRALRAGGPMCLLLLDLDRFKQVNDRFGHQEGDRVLKALAEVLTRTLRTVDAVARIGGEEFAVLLPDTGYEAGLETAERVRAEVATIALPEGFLTTSLGLAAWNPEETFESWYQRADRALYLAKESGRNQVGRAS